MNIIFVALGTILSASACKVKIERQYSVIGSGYCVDFEPLMEGFFPETLNSSNVLYSEDKAEECMRRCVNAAGNHSDISILAFTLRLSDGACLCSKGSCASRFDSLRHPRSCENNTNEGPGDVLHSWANDATPLSENDLLDAMEEKNCSATGQMTKVLHAGTNLKCEYCPENKIVEPNTFDRCVNCVGDGTRTGTQTRCYSTTECTACINECQNPVNTSDTGSSQQSNDQSNDQSNYQNYQNRRRLTSESECRISCENKGWCLSNSSEVSEPSSNNQQQQQQQQRRRLETDDGCVDYQGGYCAADFVHNVWADGYCVGFEHNTNLTEDFCNSNSMIYVNETSQCLSSYGDAHDIQHMIDLGVINQTVCQEAIWSPARCIGDIQIHDKKVCEERGFSQKELIYSESNGTLFEKLSRCESECKKLESLKLPVLSFYVNETSGSCTCSTVNSAESCIVDTLVNAPQVKHWNFSPRRFASFRIDSTTIRHEYLNGTTCLPYSTCPEGETQVGTKEPDRDIECEPVCNSKYYEIDTSVLQSLYDKLKSAFLQLD